MFTAVQKVLEVQQLAVCIMKNFEKEVWSVDLLFRMARVICGR